MPVLPRLSLLLLLAFFGRAVYCKRFCFEIEVESVKRDRYLCNESPGADLDTLRTQFEYYIYAEDRVSMLPVGNTVIFDDACYIEGERCSLEYCVVYEEEDDIDLIVGQTKFRKNREIERNEDFWAFSLSVNGISLGSDLICSEQFEVVKNMSCACQGNVFSLSGMDSVPSFQLNINELAEGESTFNNTVVSLFIGLAVVVAAVAIVLFSTQQRARKRVNLANLGSSPKALRSVNPRIAKEHPFSYFLTSQYAPKVEGCKPVVKREADEEEIENFRQLKERAMGQNNNLSFKSFSPRLSASISFKVEQRLIALQNVFIERILFLIIDTLQVNGPGQTPKTTTFRDEMNKLSQNFRKIPLGSYLESLRDAVNDFTEEEDEDAGNSMGNKCLLIAVIYLDIARRENPGLVINDANIRNLLFVATLLATKFMDDYLIPNSYWADFSSIELKSVNEMEVSFCSFIKYDLFVTSQEIKHWVSELENGFMENF